MYGTIINVIAILIGGAIGLMFHKKTPQIIGDRIMEGFGLFVIVVGIAGAIEGDNPILYIFSIMIGAIIGEVLNLDRKLNDFTHFLKDKMKTKDEDNFKEGFISTTIFSTSCSATSTSSAFFFFCTFTIDFCITRFANTRFFIST